MAIVGVNPVAPAQKRTISKGGKLGGQLGALGGVIGGVAGGIAGMAGGPLAALQGATLGAAQGAGAGGTLGSLIDPARAKTVSQAPQSMGSAGGGQGLSIAEKYKMSQNGRIILDALQVAKSIPAYAEYQKPLGMAILQDIAANNPQRMA